MLILKLNISSRCRYSLTRIQRTSAMMLVLCIIVYYDGISSLKYPSDTHCIHVHFIMTNMNMCHSSYVQVCIMSQLYYFFSDQNFTETKISGCGPRNNRFKVRAAFICEYVLLVYSSCILAILPHDCEIKHTCV
jgi:hypothetical protein